MEYLRDQVAKYLPYPGEYVPRVNTYSRWRRPNRYLHMYASLVRDDEKRQLSISSNSSIKYTSRLECFFILLLCCFAALLL